MGFLDNFKSLLGGKNDFINKNAVPAELEPYLGFGAILVSRNQDPAICLNMINTKKDICNLLEDSWEVTDGNSAKETIRYTLEEVVPDNISDASLYFTGEVAFEAEERAALDMIAGVLGKGLVDKCNTPIGFDLERISFVVRASYYCGYITEEEAWQYLKSISKMSGCFSHWSQYAASFLIGRVILFSEDIEDMLISVEALLNNKDSVWNKHPIDTVNK